MGRGLLSVDWDYFISVKDKCFGSYVENNRTRVDLWYKRYLLCKKQNKNIYSYFKLSEDVNRFWDQIKRAFIFDNKINVYVSDSHKLSYYIAKAFSCDTVYLFDAHADLGYVSDRFDEFEVNCSNWLGKLLAEGVIKRAYIIYSPYTLEKPDDFKYMNDKYNIVYLKSEDLDSKIEVFTLHICRSGAWTPPWYDNKFMEFVNSLGLSYEITDCPKREWNTKNITFSDELYYLMA
ncbi:MAG: hypothetical protein LOD89_03215 [Tissierellales bacterium]